jgi:ankyrin repeat protein
VIDFRSSVLRVVLTISVCSAGIAAGGSAPSLVAAAKSGDATAVRTLLAKSKDIVNVPDGDGTTALHWAAYHDDLDTADLLIRAGAKVNAANDLGVTPLWAASENGSVAMAKRLLDAGADPNLALLSGETPLLVAARSGHTAVIELLADKGANLNARGTRGQTALMWAASQKHPDAVKALLAHHADISAKSDVWSEVMAVPPHGYLGYNKLIPHGGETALMFAARVGDLESAKLLVDAGANVNDADAWGISAVTLAAHSDFREVVTFLLDKGADPNAAPNGFTALHTAIMWRDEPMVEALLAHGADANAPLKTWTPTRRSSHDWNFAPELVGATPFWLAARFDEPGVMRMLLKHGADAMFVQHGDKMAESRGGHGYEHRLENTTALMASLGMGGGSAWSDVPKTQREPLAFEAVKMLVDLGVDVNYANVDGRTALDAANGLKYPTVIELLTSKGAKASGKKGPAKEIDN